MSPPTIPLPPLTSFAQPSRPREQPQYSFNSKVMLAAMLILFVVVVFVICLHVYAKWFWRPGSGSPWRHRRLRRRRHNVFPAVLVPADATHISPASAGLDAAVISSLPTFIYQTSEQHHADATQPLLECAVCLSEFQDREKGRILPNCKHTFHIACIDAWFRSHSTCPLCRAAVSQWAPSQSDPAPPFAHASIQPSPPPPRDLNEQTSAFSPTTTVTRAHLDECGASIAPPSPHLQGIQVQGQHQEGLASILCRHDTYNGFQASLQKHQRCASGSPSTSLMSVEIRGRGETDPSILRCQSLSMQRSQSEDSEAGLLQPIKSRSFRLSIKRLLSRDMSRGRGRVFPSEAGPSCAGQQDESSSISRELPL